MINRPRKFNKYTTYHFNSKPISELKIKLWSLQLTSRQLRYLIRTLVILLFKTVMACLIKMATTFAPMTSSLSSLGIGFGASRGFYTGGSSGCGVGVIRDPSESRYLKPVNEMPGPTPILPYFGTEWLYSKLGPFTQDNMHHVAREAMFHQYGPIYKEHLGGAPVVSLYKNEHIAQAFRSEGRYPLRAVNEANIYWRTKNKDKYSTVGLLDTVGHEWYEIRTVVAETILKDDAGPMFTERLSRTSDEFIKLLRREMGPDGYIADIRPYLYRLGLESMWRSLFGKELGALRKFPPPEATALVKHTVDLIHSFAELSLSRPLWKICPAASPTFRKFSNADSKIYDIVVPYSQMVEKEIMEKSQKEAETGLPTSAKDETGSYMARFLKNDKFDRRFLTTMVVDFVAAGIPSTAYFTSMILHRVAQEEALQNRIQKVLDDSLPEEDSLITEQIYKQNLRLLKYTIKEGGRLTTTIPMISRILPVDVKVDDYYIPANTPLLLNTRVSARQESNFWNALEFIPDRWMFRYPNETVYRDDQKMLDLFRKQARSGNFLVLPFGHGKRSCVGRALAEREMAITLAKILRNFRMESQGELTLGNLFLLAPVKPVSLWLKPREK